MLLLLLLLLLMLLLLLLLLLLMLPLLLLLLMLLLLLPIRDALPGATAKATGKGRGFGALNSGLEVCTFFILGSPCASAATCSAADNTNTISSLLGCCSSK